MNLINNIDSLFFAEKNKIFLDIGSGTGKVVIGFYLFSLFKKCIGIELMENLYLKSELIKEKVLLEDNKNEISFINCDIFDYNIKDIDMIFANSTCWTKDFLDKLRIKFDKEGKEGLIVINTDQNMFNINAEECDYVIKNWDFFQKIKIDSNWGYSYLYVSRKVK